MPPAPLVDVHHRPSLDPSTIGRRLVLGGAGPSAVSSPCSMVKATASFAGARRGACGRRQVVSRPAQSQHLRDGGGSSGSTWRRQRRRGPCSCSVSGGRCSVPARNPRVSAISAAMSEVLSRSRATPTHAVTWSATRACTSWPSCTSRADERGVRARALGALADERSRSCSAGDAPPAEGAEAAPCLRPSTMRAGVAGRAAHVPRAGRCRSEALAGLDAGWSCRRAKVARARAGAHPRRLRRPSRRDLHPHPPLRVAGRRVSRRARRIEGAPRLHHGLALASFPERSRAVSVPNAASIAIPGTRRAPPRRARCRAVGPPRGRAEPVRGGRGLAQWGLVRGAGGGPASLESRKQLDACSRRWSSISTSGSRRWRT
jgi:hypothetical protein